MLSYHLMIRCLYIGTLGFFQILTHGISPTLQETAKETLFGAQYFYILTWPITSMFIQACLIDLDFQTFAF